MHRPRPAPGRDHLCRPPPCSLDSRGGPARSSSGVRGRARPQSHLVAARWMGRSSGSPATLRSSPASISSSTASANLLRSRAGRGAISSAITVATLTGSVLIASHWKMRWAASTTTRHSSSARAVPSGSTIHLDGPSMKDARSDPPPADLCDRRAAGLTSPTRCRPGRRGAPAGPGHGGCSRARGAAAPRGRPSPNPTRQAGGRRPRTGDPCRQDALLTGHRAARRGEKFSAAAFGRRRRASAPDTSGPGSTPTARSRRTPGASRTAADAARSHDQPHSRRGADGPLQPPPDQKPERDEYE
jgi:hypothetical protein